MYSVALSFAAWSDRADSQWRPDVHRAALAEVSEGERVARIRAGDLAMFERVFLAYAQELCAFAFRLVQSRDEAQDIVQDVFYKMWRGREQLTVRGTLGDYLYAAVRNTARNRIAHDHVVQRLSPAAQEAIGAYKTEGPDGADVRLERADQLRVVMQALAALPERRRAICRLRWVDGLSYAAIARRMGVSEKTVETQLNRGIRELRDRLRDSPRDAADAG